MSKIKPYSKEYYNVVVDTSQRCWCCNTVVGLTSNDVANLVDCHGDDWKEQDIDLECSLCPDDCPEVCR